MRNKLKQIFCNLNYHWHKRLSTHKSIEVEAYSGLIDFSNKVYMLVSTRGINFELSSKPRFNTEKELLQYYNAIPFSEWENKMRDKLGCNLQDVLSEEQRQYFDNSFSQIESNREQEEFIEQCRRELEARVIELRNKKQ